MNYLYVLEKTTHYDSHNQCYRQIITINQMPKGPLQQMVRQIRNTPNSPFQIPPPVCCPPKRCILAIADHHGQLMCVNSLPNLFQFLMQNGYEIDTTLTNIMEKSEVKLDNTLICYIKYKIENN